MDSLTIPIPPEIQDFLEKLLAEGKITPDDPELKQTMIEDLYQRVQVQLMQVLAENLGAADLERYSELAQQDQLKAAEFLKSKQANMPELMLKAMAEFRQVFLS